ncbi:radical SAM/SPASM domain-containing protein [Thermodesulfobacteriota bacterium]
MWKQGNIIKYLINRYQWHLYPKMGKVSPFPLHVDIETTAKCNLRCPMCPSRHLSEKEYAEYDHMDFELYKNLVDECARNKVFSIRLSWRGEALTTPDFAEYVRYAKIVKKIPNVSFLTNGAMLKGKLAEKLIDYGADYISVSIDGLKECYEVIRYPVTFETIYNNLKAFKKLKKEKRKSKPVIRITTLWPAVAKEPKAFYDKMSPVCDKIVYNPLKDYSLTEPIKKDFICQFPWERLFVAFNGDVQPCSNTKDKFIIGNALHSSLKDIWNSEKMRELRDTHSEGRRMDIFPCNRCSYGIDYSNIWQDRDWTDWNPRELLPEGEGRNAEHR